MLSFFCVTYNKVPWRQSFVDDAVTTELTNGAQLNKKIKNKNYNILFQTQESPEPDEPGKSDETGENVETGEPGAYSEISVTDPDVLKAAEEAFEFYKKMVPLLSLTFHEVVKAEVLTVGGNNYKITFRTDVADVNDFFVYCDAVVNKEPDLTFKTQKESCEPKFKE